MFEIIVQGGKMKSVFAVFFLFFVTALPFSASASAEVSWEYVTCNKCSNSEYKEKANLRNKRPYPFDYDPGDIIIYNVGVIDFFNNKVVAYQETYKIEGGMTEHPAAGVEIWGPKIGSRTFEERSIPPGFK